MPTADPNATLPLAKGPAIAEPAGSTVRKSRFGDYELLEEIARGGMGVVYKARQVSLDRIVALKMILTGKLAGAEEVERFRVEARAVAQLQHSSIVAIYDVGEHENQQYFTMEYVPGSSLAQRLEEGVLPSRLAAHYVHEVALGLHYAHLKGILHRDLKPANILLDDQDRPKLTDFGLAKILAGKDDGVAAVGRGDLTATGAVMGTPSYMAPEQAGCEPEKLGPATDVYGLGAVLYEVLTGRPPFMAESPVETILQVLNQDAVPPRVLNPHVDADLETICMKCLEKDPLRRYPTAKALAEDLERYQNDEPITARGVNLIDRLTRALAASQHDKEFRAWGVGIILFGVIIFLGHAAATFLLEAGHTETTAFWIPRGVQFVLLGLTLWFARRHSLLPTSKAERLIWAVWIGYLLAYYTLSEVMTELGHPHVQAFAPAAALTGLAFFIMGCHVWGWCYLFGLAFMGLSMALAANKHPNSSPLWFGALWGVSLLIIGARYYWIGQKAERER